MTRTPTDEVKRQKRRALGKAAAYVVVYAVIAAPGAYSALKSQGTAERSTVAAVNKQATERVVELQAWVKANAADVEKVRKQIADLRQELAQDRRELTRLLVDLARRGRRPPSAEIRRRAEALVPPPAPAPRPTAAAKRPKLSPVQKTLDGF